MIIDADMHGRFARAQEQVELIADIPDDMPWIEARKILAERLAARFESDERANAELRYAASPDRIDDAGMWREEVEMMGRALDD